MVLEISILSLSKQGREKKWDEEKGSCLLSYTKVSICLRDDLPLRSSIFLIPKNLGNTLWNPVDGQV